MAHGVHGPRDVPHPADAEEKSPKHARQPTEGVQAHDRQDDGVQGVGLLQEAVEPLRGEVAGVALVAPHPRALGIEQPARVRPPEAVKGRVHIALGLRAAMVVPVGRDPVDGVALQSQGAAVGKDVLEPLGRLEGPVGQLPVVRQRNAKEPGDQIPHEEADEGLPSEVEGSEKRAEVDGREDDGVHHVLPQPLAREVGARVHSVVPELPVPYAEDPLRHLAQRQHLRSLGPLCSWQGVGRGLHHGAPSCPEPCARSEYRGSGGCRQRGTCRPSARRMVDRRRRLCGRGWPAEALDQAGLSTGGRARHGKGMAGGVQTDGRQTGQHEAGGQEGTARGGGHVGNVGGACPGAGGCGASA
mmetsp:Transcript_47428/g.148595  ORF Transcript_47428/g.148595 Transcript_47428/m.148595 type:complete len:357 (+) Transcript_47428:364-1434(+)